MEDIKTILDSIRQHTTAEANAYASNRTIGRGRVKIGKVTEKTIWVANVGYQSSNRYYTTDDGRVESVSNANVHTYTGDGATVISKNTAPGRLIMEHYSGIHPYMAPAGRMSMEIYNAAYYTQPQGRNAVYDLSVGIAGQQRRLNFANLESALSSYLKLINDRAKTEDIIAKRERELEEKRKAEEAAKIAAQKARDEEERRKREEALHLAEEERRRTEEEILKHKEENKIREQQAKEYEETYNFIRMQASLRLNPRLDPSQNDVKFSHVFDGVTTIIEGGPGTGKSTTLIQRLKLLIDAGDLEDYAINNPEANLTQKKIEIATARNGWVFFSPTDLLCKYLKEDMAYEGLTQYEDKTHVWKDFLRKSLIRDDYKIAGAQCRFVFTKKNGEDGLFIGDQLQVAKDFQQYYIDSLKKRLLKVAAVDYSKFSWKILGKMIADTCKEVEKAEDLGAICRLLFKLNAIKDIVMPAGVPSAKDIVSAYVSRVDEITNKYLVAWKKDEDFYEELLDCEEDILDTDETTVSVVDVDEEDTIDKTNDITIELQKDIKRLIRRIASSKDDASLVIEPVYEELYDLLRDKIKREDLKQISEIAYFNKEVYPCISNVEVFLLNVDYVCNTYLSFRKECFEKKDANWNQEILEKMVGVTSKNYIHHDECSLLIGVINNILIRVARLSEDRFDSFTGRFANAYKKNRKAVIGIDEATDYSLIDYYAMYSLRHHAVSSFTLSGDMMQSMNEFGIKDWKSLQNPLIFDKVDVKQLRVSYRQGPKLIKLAHYLYNKATGKRAPYSCYLKDEKNTPDPLWFKSNDLEEKAAWMAKRVLEVQTAYKKVPSIAIFVNTTKEAQDLYDALKSEEILENAGIDVINCTANDELYAPDSIRIFLLERVKGMEFEVVFFYNIDEVTKAKLIDQYLYVGLSRATFYMAVASNEIEDEQLLELSERFNKRTKWRPRKRLI
jgi:superfamily I DNA/RNA helicase